MGGELKNWWNPREYGTSISSLPHDTDLILYCLGVGVGGGFETGQNRFCWKKPIVKITCMQCINVPHYSLYNSLLILVFLFTQKQMQKIMIHCFNSVKHKLQSRIGFFDLFGLDFMVDTDMKVRSWWPWEPIWKLQSQVVSSDFDPYLQLNFHNT